MKVLTDTEARAVKETVAAFLKIGTPYFKTTIGEGDATATFECDEGIITVRNGRLTEVYQDLRAFCEKYGV